MEQLPKSQQDALRKASTDRLREILSKANWTEPTVLTAMSRDELLEAAAQLELTRAKTATGGPVGTPSLEPAVERERLEFEKYKFEIEVKRADEERALQREKLAAEREQRDLEMKKLAEQRDFEMKKLAETAALEREKLAAERVQRELESKRLAEAAALEREKLEHEASEAAAQRQH